MAVSLCEYADEIHFAASALPSSSIPEIENKVGKEKERKRRASSKPAVNSKHISYDVLLGISHPRSEKKKHMDFVVCSHNYQQSHVKPSLPFTVGSQTVPSRRRDTGRLSRLFKRHESRSSLDRNISHSQGLRYCCWVSSLRFVQPSRLFSRNPTQGTRLLNAKLLKTTEMLLKAIARLAHTGSSLTWLPFDTMGMRTPAAIGTANTL